MTADPIWITEEDVVSLMHLGEAVDALERGLLLEAGGGATNMDKTAAHWGAGSNMHAIGAVFEAAGVFGTKTWGHTAGGSTPLLVLWDATDGRLLAIIESFALGQMRTGAMSGVATRWMSSPRADELAVVGAGKQALTQVAAVFWVRPVRRVRIYSPTKERREAFAAKLQDLYPGAEFLSCEQVEAAVDGAPLVTLITRAREPLVTAAMLARGVHVNAVGAITPERREFARDLFTRAELVAVDTIESTRRSSSEFIDWYDGVRGGDWSPVRRIADLVARHVTGPEAPDLTLFKAMGMGISDLAVGLEVLQRARTAGRGRPIPHPARATPRLFEPRD
jgi:ornithine cyclodeaminase